MQSSPPSILFLCQNLPFPPDGGAHLRSFHTLRVLSSRFDVHAICLYRKAVRPTEADVEAGIQGLQQYTSSLHVFALPEDGSVLARPWTHFRSLVSGRAYVWYSYLGSQIRDRLLSLLDELPIRLAHLESMDLAAYLPDLVGRLPVACVHHNEEAMVLARRASVEPNPLVRHYLKHQASRVRALERHWCPKINLNFAVSEEDRTRFVEIAPESRFSVSPNGVDTEGFSPQRATVDPDSVLFVGNGTWFPNRDGVEFFVRDVLPHLRDLAPRVRVTWVGRSGGRVRTMAEQHGVRCTGYVNDVREFFGSAACVIAPIRVGGGTRLKILDAWAEGKAVVSTTVGAEGLNYVGGRDILIADRPREFAERVVSVLEDPGLRGRLERSARNLVETQYDWRVVLAPMIRAYLDLIGEDGQGNEETQTGALGWT